MELSVVYNNLEVKQIVMRNIVKLLFRRKLITNEEKVYNNLDITDIRTTIYTIKCDNDNTVDIYFIPQKLNNIPHNSPLDNYLSKNPDVLKILILNEVIKKALKQIIHDYQNTNFFFEHEFMEDIPSKNFIPEHQLLSSEQKQELLTVFSESEFAAILSTDIMARYYGGRVGDIFRIIRPSTLAGKNIFYRKVINGSLDIF